MNKQHTNSVQNRAITVIDCGEISLNADHARQPFSSNNKKVTIVAGRVSSSKTTFMTALNNRLVCEVKNLHSPETIS